MKKTQTIWTTMIILIIAGCSGGAKQSNNGSDELFTIDVTANYPKKDFILQDFFDIEYIPLETTDEFVSESIPLAIGDKIIIVRNSQNGDIFIFNRKNGKGIRKINRQGQSGEEYVYNYNALLDEDKGELIICDRKILVFDLEGNFKRSFDPKKNAQLGDVTNFDSESFIWRNTAFDFDMDNTAIEMPMFFLTSKQDGSIIKEIQIPIDKRKSSVIMWRDGDMVYSMGPRNKTIIPFKDEMILTEASSDTVYKYTQDHKLIPFIARTPSVQSMDPEVFLLPGIVSDDNCFMEINTKKRGASDTSLMLDRKTGEVFQSTVYNGDYSNKQSVNMFNMGKNGNPNVAFWQPIPAHRLVEAYERNELKGNLKEIAAKLDDDANAVIMIAKYKK